MTPLATGVCFGAPPAASATPPMASRAMNAPTATLPFRTLRRLVAPSAPSSVMLAPQVEGAHGVAPSLLRERPLAERLHYRPLDQTLRDIDFVGIQTHRPSDRPNLRRRGCDGAFDVLALEGILDDLGAIGHRRNTAEHHATVGPGGATRGEGHRDRRQGEVVDLAVLELRPAHLDPRGRRGNEHLGQHFVRFEDVLAQDIFAWPD